MHRARLNQSKELQDPEKIAPASFYRNDSTMQLLCKTEDIALLELALEKSQIVKEKVEECAGDIGNANVHVKEMIAVGATTLPAHETLATSTELEGKVQECADDLNEVTDTLAKGIEELRQTETLLVASRRDLIATRAALAVAKEGEKDARSLAQHDAKTGLPNRSLFDTRVGHAIALADRHAWTLAVMFFDLDHFKEVNDTHGHAAGDAVLSKIADRLADHARDEDTVCRNGGDEFLYLLVNPQGRDNVERIARNVAERVAQEIVWEGVVLTVGTSIGVAFYPEDGATCEDLIRSADAAMYSAKRRGCGFAFS